MSSTKGLSIVVLWALVCSGIVWHLTSESLDRQKRAHKCIESGGMMVEQYNREICVAVNKIAL